MKVFLANPPWRIGDRWGVRAGSRWPFTVQVKKDQKSLDYIPFPFFLAYATAILEKNDIPALLVDAIAEGMDEEQFVAKVKDYAPDSIVLETSTPSIAIDLSLAKRIKNQLENTSIALCGPHISVFPQETLKQNPFVDYILIGEYEYTLLDLVNHLQKGQRLDDVQGLAYRRESNIKVNSRRPPIEHLDELPWPARHFLPMYNYKDAFCGLPTPSLQIWASRGCPYKCIFCLWPDIMYGGHSYRTRDPKKVVDEIEWCIKEYGFKSVYFDDDIVNIGKERMLRLATEIKNRNFKIPWAIMARADVMDKEMLEVMTDAGLYALKYGIESGVQEIIDASGKILDLNKARKIVGLTKQLGIKTHLTFTFGLPGETKGTIRKTIDFVTELDCDSLQFSLCTPFPGTKYYYLAEEMGWLLSKDWSDYDGSNKSVLKTQALTAEELEEALYKAPEIIRIKRIKRNLRNKKWYYLSKALQHPLKAIETVLKMLCYHWR